jgi:DNA-binding NarL/FixJ family response regulator
MQVLPPGIIAGILTSGGCFVARANTGIADSGSRPLLSALADARKAVSMSRSISPSNMWSDCLSAVPEVELLIISGSCVVREGLAALLIGLGHVKAECCRTYEPFPDLSPRLSHGRIVLLDGSSTVGPMLDWIAACHANSPRTGVMVIELLDSMEPILAYVRAGVRAYTLRGAPIAEIVTAFQTLYNGDGYCPPSLTSRLFEHLVQPARAEPLSQPAGLSPRELEVLRYLVADYSNQQIADKLVISVRTVKHHVHSILQKMGVRHRWDAARLAQCEDLLQKS